MRQKMRVLFLSNFYPPYEIGGYEQWCQEVATQLMRHGHHVSVLTSRYGVRAERVDDAPNVTRVLHLQSDVDYYRPSDFFLRRPRQERENIQALRESIARVSPDVLMVWGMWHLSHNLPYWAERWMPGRVAYFISNYWPVDVDPHTEFWQLPTRRPQLGWVKRPLRSVALGQLRREGYPPQLRFEHAVCCSQYVRDTLVKAGRLPDSAGVLLGGTDPEPFLRHSRLSKSRPNGPVEFLYFGRLIHDKGVHTALEAIGLLKQRGLLDGARFTVLGSGHPAYEAELRQMLQQLDIGDRVKFVQQVSREKVPEWLGQYDVFLFTSIWPEPMARSVMEAMAAGLLVIGSEVGGQVEMLENNRNALTFQAEDAATLADNMERVLEDRSLALRLARAGQQTVLERFTLDRMVDEIERYLMDIVGNRHQ
jgi:glycosyltransferase involved in cell wall biosynthesis